MCIRHLLSIDGADVNRRDRWDSTPLYYACLAGRLQLYVFCPAFGKVMRFSSHEPQNLRQAKLVKLMRNTFCQAGSF